MQCSVADFQIPVLMVYLVFMWIWSLTIFLATILVLHRFHREQNSSAEEIKGNRDAHCLHCWQKTPPLAKHLKGNLFPCLAWIKFTILGKNRVSSKAPTDRDNSQHEQDPQVIQVKETQAVQSQDQVQDCSTTPCHAGPDRCCTVKQPGFVVRAKTLDKVFFTLSLIIVTTVDITVFFVYYTSA